MKRNRVAVSVGAPAGDTNRRTALLASGKRLIQEKTCRRQSWQPLSPILLAAPRREVREGGTPFANMRDARVTQALGCTRP